MSIPWIALSSLLWHIFACVTLVSFCTVKRCNCDGLGTKAKRKKKLATSSANEKPVVEHTVRISLSQTCHSSDFAAPDSTDPTQADQRLSQDTMTLDNKDGTTKTTKTEATQEQTKPSEIPKLGESGPKNSEFVTKPGEIGAPNCSDYVMGHKA